MKKIVKPLFLVVLISFLGLYVFYNNGYSEMKIRKDKILMDNMLLEYEKDLANGVDVTKKEYILVEEDYSNVYTRMFLSASSEIEKIIDSGIKLIFKKINNMVNE